MPRRRRCGEHRAAGHTGPALRIFSGGAFVALASPFGRGGRAQRGRRVSERSSGPPCGPVFPRCPQAAESPGRRGGPPPGGQAQCRFTVCPPGDGPPRRPGPTAGHPTPQQAATTTAPPHGTPPPPPPKNQTGAAAARAAPPTGGAIQIVAPAAQSHPRLRGKAAGDTGGGVGGQTPRRARSTGQTRRSTTPAKTPPKGGRRRHLLCARPLITGWCGGRTVYQPPHYPPEKRIRFRPPADAVIHEFFVFLFPQLR